ncbi:MAG TPA: hypothetical protein VIW29_06730 [Polyangiaceae bacterium]
MPQVFRATLIKMLHGPPAKANSSLRLVAIVVTALSVIFAAGLFILIFYMVRPRGDKLGETSLTEPSNALAVNGKQGDTLVFRVDASVRVPSVGLLSDDQIEELASSRLAKSLLTVHAIAPSGTEHTTSCALYKGRAASTTSTSGTFARSGMLTDCTIVLDQPGTWKVRGSVAWHAELSLSSATLETRLDAASR